MSDFLSTLSGAIVGGGAVVIGQALERKSAAKRWRVDRKAETLGELQDAVMYLARAAVDAGEHAGDAAWQPTRYEGLRLRVLGKATQTGDASVLAAVNRLLELAEPVAEGALGQSQAMFKSAEACVDSTGRVALGLEP